MTDVYERLETGWWPDTPADDTVLRAAVLALGDSCAELAETADGSVTRTPDLVTALAGSPCAYLNTIVPLAPPDTWDELSVPPENTAVTLMSAWPTPDLRVRRWHLVGHPPLMHRPAGPGVAVEPHGLDVVEVSTPDELAEVSRTIVMGYPLDDLTGAPEFFPSGLLASDGWRFWLGLSGATPVCASAAYVTDPVVLVAWVATLPQARGRGFGEAMTWQATLAAPGRPAVLLSSDLGRPLYERMGYTALMRFTVWAHDAGRIPR